MTAQTISNTAPSAQNVVSNDTLADVSINERGFQASHAVIEQLVVEAETWHNTVFKTSNEQLYGLLAKCYGFYKAMEPNTPEADALRRGFDDYINLKGYSFGKETHTLSKIVKCVFGGGLDRRRVSSYGIVLRKALFERVSVEGLPAYIREKGGVEEIRLHETSSSMTTKQKAEAASSVLASSELGSFSCAALSAMLDAGKIGKNTLLIGTWQADGSVAVRAVVESDTALNAALAAHYAATKAEIAAAQKERDEQAKAAKAADAVHVAAENAKLVQ